MATTENHVIKFTPDNWVEIRRCAKANRITEHQVVDDIMAYAGDLDAIFDGRGTARPWSTRAAVLEQTNSELIKPAPAGASVQELESHAEQMTGIADDLEGLI